MKRDRRYFNRSNLGQHNLCIPSRYQVTKTQTEDMHYNIERVVINKKNFDILLALLGDRARSLNKFGSNLTSLLFRRRR